MLLSLFLYICICVCVCTSNAAVDGMETEAQGLRHGTHARPYIHSFYVYLRHASQVLMLQDKVGVIVAVECIVLALRSSLPLRAGPTFRAPKRRRRRPCRTKLEQVDGENKGTEACEDLPQSSGEEPSPIVRPGGDRGGGRRRCRRRCRFHLHGMPQE